MLGFFTIPVLWGISSVAPEFVTVVLGTKWVPAVLPLQLLPLVMPLTVLSGFLNSAFQGIGRGDVVFSNVLTATLVMPLAFWIGMHWELLGLSLAWIVGFPLVMMLNLRRMLPLVDLNLRGLAAAVWPTALTGAAMYAAVAVARYLMAGAQGVLHLALLVAVGAATYGALAWFANRSVVLEVAELLGVGRLRAT